MLIGWALPIVERLLGGRIAGNAQPGKPQWRQGATDVKKEASGGTKCCVARFHPFWPNRGGFFRPPFS
jgi:hypothetical protein